MRPLDDEKGFDGEAAGCESAGAAVPESLLGSARRREAAVRGGAGNPMHKHSHPRRMDLVWLIYSVFFFIEPWERKDAWHWAGFAVFYALFLAAYAGVLMARTRRMALGLLGAMALLGFVYYPFNAGIAGVFIYVIAFLPFVVDWMAVNIAVYVAVSLGMAVEGTWMHQNPWSWGVPIFIAFAVGSGNLMVAQRIRAAQKLNLAQEEIAHLAKVAERERIARDLHDVLGHTLSLVVLKSELAGKLLERDVTRARKEMAEVEEIARTALKEVREAIRGYRSEGLAAEINRARATLEAAGVKLECPAGPPRMGATEETVVSLIVREGVTNIVRHAQASRCRIGFEGTEAGTVLTIEDDGRGGVRLEGNGLRGMRERVELLGGRLRVESEAGTRLVIEIPEKAGV